MADAQITGAVPTKACAITFGAANAPITTCTVTVPAGTELTAPVTITATGANFAAQVTTTCPGGVAPGTGVPGTASVTCRVCRVRCRRLRWL